MQLKVENDLLRKKKKSKPKYRTVSKAIHSAVKLII